MEARDVDQAARRYESFISIGLTMLIIVSSRDTPIPMQTPAGGVPVGWPHIDNPRMRRVMGLSDMRDEL